MNPCEPLLDDDLSVPESAVRAHAMKNCIATIHAIAYLLEREIRPEGRSRLARLRETVARLVELVDEDLVPPSTEEGCLVSEVLDDVRARCVDGAARSGIELRVGGDEAACIAMPRADLVEVLLNLVKNATEATAPGGAITVAAIPLPDHRLEIRVSDTGCGMSAVDVARYGQAYRTSKTGGSGVGVAASMEVLARHGARLAVDSLPGRGTRVTLLVPRHEPDHGHRPRERVEQAVPDHVHLHREEVRRRELARQHVVPLQYLVQHDPVDEAAEARAEEEACGDQGTEPARAFTHDDAPRPSARR